jgi:signal transduction histidine kinase
MKLFGKIFLWFLAATALMWGVIIFVTRTFQTEPMFSRWQRSARNQLLFYGGTTEQVSAIGDKAQLHQLLARLEDNTAIKEVKLVTQSGEILYGTSEDVGDFSELSSRAAVSGGPEIDVSRTDSALGVERVKLSDGRSAMLAVRWEPPRAPSLFFDSWLGYLRLIGLFLTGIILCAGLAIYLTGPIRRLREATQKLAAGDLQTRVPRGTIRRRDELADLARDFDVMAERIESLVTSQRRLASDVSHELRSPLARLNVALEIAKQKSNPETAPILDRIETESTRLNDMISRLLTLSKLESGAEAIEWRPIDLDELVKDVVADADFEARARGRFVKISSAAACTVMGSESLLRSAVENVLRNAVRYTPEQTVVNVSLAADNGHATLQIADHGGGVPEKELANLFKPFYRVGEARERSTGGTGLGLAIAERAVTAHKGTIAAKNSNGGLAIEIKLDTVKPD